MFKFDTQCNPRQISLTGVRAIVIMPLLNIKPSTFEEIKEFLIESNIVTREYDGKVLTSIDTDICTINTISKIITIMATANQFILPTLNINKY